ncbi:MAG: TatD family hydrolase [Acidobacteriaceae bacterium]
MKFFDSHCHVNFIDYKNDSDEVIKRSLEEGVGMVTVGSQASTSKSAVETANRYEKGVYCSIGLHPLQTSRQMVEEEDSHFMSREEHFDEQVYEKLLGPKVVAVGECGLEYFRMPEEGQEEYKRKQKQAFVAQLNFAKKHSLPAIIHCRDAYEDLIEIMKAEYQGKPAIIHSFTSDWNTGKRFLDLGFYLAFNAILMFDKTGRIAEVVKNTPLDRILAETDAPYLAPAPYRGKRNEPAYVKYTTERIAQIKGMSTDEMGNQTVENAKKIYGIKD